jgi:hypothetical protein
MYHITRMRNEWTKPSCMQFNLYRKLPPNSMVYLAESCKVNTSTVPSISAVSGKALILIASDSGVKQ